MTKYKTKELFAEETKEPPCRHIIRVAFESAADTEFDYGVPDEMWPIPVGQRVEAPFGRKNKLEKGFCVEADIPFENSFAAHNKSHKLKTITSVIDKEPLLDAELMDLARWISGYYVCPLGQVLAAMVPAAVKKGAGVKTIQYVFLPTDSEQGRPEHRPYRLATGEFLVNQILIGYGTHQPDNHAPDQNRPFQIPLKEKIYARNSRRQ